MSIRIRGTYFDGSASAGLSANATLMPDGSVELMTVEGTHRFEARSVRISSRLGGTARYFTFPDGGKLQTLDNDDIDEWLANWPDRPSGIVHALERHWGWVAFSIIFTAGFVWWGVGSGLPWLAGHAASAIPLEVEQAMGDQAMASLDASWFQPSELSSKRRREVRELFAGLRDTLETEIPLQLELRASEAFGANAFALPSGIIVVTDDMVELADNELELLAVLAHEAGHVHHRHVMRSILQNSAVAVALAVLLGDVTSVTGLAASIPTLLVESGYSRRFEFEADAYARDYFDSQGIDRSHLAAILSKLGEETGTPTFTDYLSTHPSTGKRVEAIQD